MIPETEENLRRALNFGPEYCGLDVMSDRRSRARQAGGRSGGMWTGQLCVLLR